MKTKKIISLLVTGIVAVSLLAGCGSKKSTNGNSATKGKYQDGLYYASEDKFSNGWKYNVVLEVKDGKIVDATWNGMSIASDKDKVTSSIDGDYGMKAKAKAKAEWHEQAALVEKYLVEKQDPTSIQYKDDAGKTDAISGATITVKEFFALADKALKGKPVEKGNYKDGYYYVEGAKSKKGETPLVELVVVNGRVVDANFNYLMNNKDGKPSDKKTISIKGQYGMDANAKAPMYEQLASAEKYLIDTQKSDLQYKDDAGKTDAISGATITVKEFFTQVEPLLKGEPKYPVVR